MGLEDHLVGVVAHGVRHAHAVLAQQFEFGGPAGVRRGQHAAVAGRHDLARMEGEHGDIATHAADLFPLSVPLDFRARGAGGVFDHCKVVAASDRHDGGEIAGQAHLVNHQDGLGLFGDRRFDQRRVNVVGVRIDIDEHRRRAAVEHDVGRGDVRMADRDYFIARADAGGDQGEVQAGGAIGDGDRVLGADKSRELLFEGRDFGALCDPT